MEHVEAFGAQSILSLARPCRAGGASSPSVSRATWRAAMAGTARQEESRKQASLRMPTVYADLVQGGGAKDAEVRQRDPACRMR